MPTWAICCAIGGALALIALARQIEALSEQIVRLHEAIDAVRDQIKGEPFNPYE